MSEVRTRAQPRGQPLFVLALILGSWMVLRVLLWQPLFGPAGLAPILSFARHGSLIGQRAAAGPVAPAARPAIPGPSDAPNAGPPPEPWHTTVPALPMSPLASPTAGPLPAKRIVGQQLLLAAAFAQMALPPEIAAYFVTGGAKGGLAGQQPLLGRAAGLVPSGSARWSGDAWLFWRRDAGGPLAAAQPSYGRSQAGAVLRYRLAPTSGHRPVAYVRASRALVGPAESELAAGFAARPLARVPVSVAGELRATDGPGGREVRPAAFAVTELPQVRLPLGLRAEAYAQAGYVGGRFATAFVDGQVRADAPVAHLGGDADLRAGGGVWGGAQKHASRLDVGPTADVTFRLGGTPSRLAVDYRMRVAGNAAPKNGPALTFSAGF